LRECSCPVSAILEAGLKRFADSTQDVAWLESAVVGIRRNKAIVQLLGFNGLRFDPEGRAFR